MDEKQLLAGAGPRSPAPPRRRHRLSRLAVAITLLGVASLTFLAPQLFFSTTRSRWSFGKTGAALREKLPDYGNDLDWQPVHATNELVPLEAHIMSKCPDARDCLRDLVLPTMQRVYQKVNFTLSYIGKPTRDGGVQCMHGPAECMGNILELCAAQLYPDPKIYLGFTMCLSFDYPAIPSRNLVEDCALEHAIDIEALNQCAAQDDGEFAMDLLQKSVQRSTDAGVTKSCTVRLDETIYCIRDNGEWKDCPAGPGVNDLILAVEKLFRQR